MRHNLYVYIVQCSDDTFYTGVTNNLERRHREHQSGLKKSAYTFGRRPVDLMWYEIYADPEVAFRVEKMLKRWSGEKKKALIEGDRELLQELAGCRNSTHHSNFKLKTKD